MKSILFTPGLLAGLRRAALLPLMTMALTVSAAEGVPKGDASTPATSAASTVAASAPAPRLPLEAFGVPMLSGLSLSPNGQQVVALINHGDGTALTRIDVAGGASKVLVATDNKIFRFNWVRWVGQDHVLASVRFAARREFVETTESRLLSIRTDGSKVFNLTKAEGVSGSMTGAVQASQFQDRVIDWMPADGKHVLLEMPPPGTLSAGVYKVAVDTGARTLVQGPERQVRTWIVDAQHRVRVGIREDEGRYEIIARAPSGGDWRTLWRFTLDEPATWPLGFGLDEQELFVLAEHKGRDAVFAVRLDQPDLPRRLLLADEKYDIVGELMHSPRTGEALGLRNAGNDSGEVARAELWSDEWRKQVQAIDEALPRRENRLLGISADEQRYMLYSSGNGSPGQYFLGDRSTGRLSLLGETYPDLPEEALVGKRAAHIRARDGLALDAFLTLPKGHAGGPLPLILMPHGGPHGRDDVDFDPWTEFLANRRYAVLQVNFRGSDGQGREFAMAGLRRWGLEMQDDLTDAVEWAVKRGVADPARVCIVGGSYGGYAALMGLVKTPSLYRCGVSFAGVTDLQDLIAYESRYAGGQAAAERQIGRYWGDRAQLRATSPALQAERIQAPVLLVHGTDDRVVPVSQSVDMDKALRRAGKKVRYIEQDGGDHHLSRNSHRLAFFKALEVFLDENLKPAQTMAKGAPGQ
ncbi:MAG: S9 family peptidase [Rubrivivax sp.]|nr:MAG: S9 family peptidase [Rubrivivax sp.]